MSRFDLKDKRDSLWQKLVTATNQQPFAVELFTDTLQQLYLIDRFWTFPGSSVLLRLSEYLVQKQYVLITHLVNNCGYHLKSGRYRQQIFTPFQTNLERLSHLSLHEKKLLERAPTTSAKPYFEVLIIHPSPGDYEMLYRLQLDAFKSPHDEFIYDILFVDCAEDALTAILANTDIQAVVYLNHILPATAASSLLFAAYSKPLLENTPPLMEADAVEVSLCRTIRCMRPEVNHYLINEESPTELPVGIRQLFNRVLFHVEPFHDLHTAILNGVRNRFSTPFFDALQTYSRQPKGVFHALPISRGASVKESPWVHDMLEFYGDNIFLAETSSTQGGLDSLLDPTGAIKQAHIKAAETFGSDYSYFVTNGTSTSNKIVMQANLKPGDIVLISADCHKSIPYSVMLTGAYPIFMETYPLPEYDLYGGIDLAQIKTIMLDLKKHNRLDRLKQITLTNSTFDGLIYNSEQFMMEILAIKPDIVFHWDEAWSAFSYFHPLYYSRTAMTGVSKIRQRMQSHEYHLFYARWASEFEANQNEDKWQQTLYPDPIKIRLRVYATQSTHKTLTSFRQGSMIHIVDDDFVQTRFLDAFRIHTSTSPNYQIIASLDIARRQAALEGFHRVRESIQLALQVRRRVRMSELLRPYFTVLDDQELIPAQFRGANVELLHGLLTMNASHGKTEPSSTLAALSANWGQSEFVIDPTRITIDVSKTGLDGTGFRQLLMTRYGIQVNKTSRNTVLFLVNIGATQATVDYLLQVLREMATLFQSERRRLAVPDAEKETIALPERRFFHPAFRPFNDGEYQASDLRTAYYQGYETSLTDYAPLSDATLLQVQAGRVLVSAGFVTPYPPGFPVIVPGQIITTEILIFFQNTKVEEIHGFSLEMGFKIFRNEYLNRMTGVIESTNRIIQPKPGIEK
jgi:arginine decarboxylase